VTGGGTPPQGPLFRCCAGIIAATLLGASGCASVPALPAGGESLSGRLSLRIETFGMQPARTLTAAFDLRGDPRAGALGLSSPLGSMLAQARWSPAEVVLVTPQGTRSFADLDALTREALGESVPIGAWFDWLRGRPWPDAPSAPAASGFTQLGWNVDLSRFVDGAVTATRETPAPAVTARIRLDRPES
jgi:outer membrane lipoprotein LolB